jgi:hypothetical protein
MKGIVAILCTVAGYVLAQYIPAGPLSIYAPLLISYHLLLAFTIVTAVQDKGVSLPIGSTVLYHVAFLVLLIVSAEARTMIPFFSIVRYFIPNLALVEAAMLFSGKGKKKQGRVEVHEQDAASNSTAEDYEEFILYMRSGHRPFAKAGRSVRDEFNSWLAHRAKNPPVPSIDSPQERPAA